MTQAKSNENESNENEKESSSFLTEGGRYKGLLGWIFSTDHKRIGILYLVSIITFFAVGLAIGLLMRLELIAPGHTIVKPDTYNAFFTFHRVVMIFLFIIPGIRTKSICSGNENRPTIGEPVRMRILVFAVRN